MQTRSQPPCSEGWRKRTVRRHRPSAHKPTSCPPHATKWHWPAARRAKYHDVASAVTDGYVDANLYTSGEGEHPGRGNAVTRWNAITTEIITADNRGVLDSRIYAMTQAAVHDALNAIEPRFESYTDGLPSSPGASIEAAIAIATASVLQAQVPGQSGAIGQRLGDALAAIPDGPAESAGVALGTQAAQAILVRRQGDGADTPGAPLPSNPANPADPTRDSHLRRRG